MLLKYWNILALINQEALQLVEVMAEISS